MQASWPKPVLDRVSETAGQPVAGGPDALARMQFCPWWNMPAVELHLKLEGLAAIIITTTSAAKNFGYAHFLDGTG